MPMRQLRSAWPKGCPSVRSSANESAASTSETPTVSEVESETRRRSGAGVLSWRLAADTTSFSARQSLELRKARLGEEEPVVLHREAAIHHHLQSPSFGDAPRFLAHHAELEPEHARSLGHGLARDVGGELGAAEHVDQIHRALDRGERGVRLETEDLGVCR